MKRPWVVAGIVAAIVLGCAAALPPVTPELAQRVNLPLSELQSGRQRYIDKCSGCHSLYPPDRFNDARWIEEVEEMAERARLSPEDRRLILQYLLAANGS